MAKKIVVVIVFLVFCNLILNSYHQKQQTDNGYVNITSKYPPKTINITINNNTHIFHDNLTDFTDEFDFKGWRIEYYGEYKYLIDGIMSGKYIYNTTGYIMVNYSKYSKYNLSLEYNPTTTAFYARILYNEHNYSTFMTISNFLLSNMTESGFFPYSFGIPEWGSPSDGSISGLAQGLVLGVFLRAFELTNNKTFLEAANKVLFSYEPTINDTYPAFRLYYPNRDISAFLEVASLHDEYNIPILNGHMYSLLALYEYLICPYTTVKGLAAKFWYQGIKFLEFNLQKFDGPFGLQRYKIDGHFNWNYFHVHVWQIELLYRITNDTFFLDYYLKWKPTLSINNPESPEINDISLSNTSAGVWLFLTTNKPSQITVECGPAGHQKIIYTNYTYSVTHRILIKAPNQEILYYFRIWLRDSNFNIRLSPRDFDIKHTFFFKSVSFHDNSFIHINYYNKTDGIMFSWNSGKIYGIVSFEFGIAGKQIEIWNSSNVHVNKGDIFISNVTPHIRYYYRITLILENYSTLIVPLYFDIKHSIVYVPSNDITNIPDLITNIPDLIGNHPYLFSLFIGISSSITTFLLLKYFKNRKRLKLLKLHKKDT